MAVETLSATVKSTSPARLASVNWSAVMFSRWFLPITFLVVSCGGGESGSVDSGTHQLPSQMSVAQRVAPLALIEPFISPLAAAAVVPTPSQAAEQLMDWAETVKPEWFDRHQITFRHGALAVRHYPKYGTYLGVATETGGGFPLNQVYVLGGPFGNTVLDVGQITNYMQPTVFHGPTSYTNFKQIGVVPRPLPRVTYDGAQSARAYLNLGTSGAGMFVADQRYLPGRFTPDTAPPSIFRFYTQTANGWTEAPQFLPQGNIGCMNPRKALVADFNGDGRPDVFVACHGYDAPPYPGERNKIVLSQPDGTYVIREPFSESGFFHSAAAADFNKDGRPDIIVMSLFTQPQAQVWLNQGDGTFVKTSALLPERLEQGGRGNNWNVVEVVDVDGDGFFDLFVAGAESRGQSTLVFLNPGNNNFAGVSPITLPSRADVPFVLDIAVTGIGADRRIWLLRTGGAENNNQGNAVQRIAWPSLQSTVPFRRTTGFATFWMLPMTVNGLAVIGSDDGSSLGFTTPDQ